MNKLKVFLAGGRPRAVRMVSGPVRRVARVVLRPLLERMDARDAHIAQLMEAQYAEIQSVLAFGWDHAALVRRVAVLEDRVETLMGRLEAQGVPEHVEPKAKVA